MCGFVGVLSWPGGAAVRRERVEAAAELVRHRGPDDHRVWADRDVVLAFHRLSVVDPTGSPQPSAFGGGRYTGVLNGEVYNHRELRAELARDHGTAFATEGEIEVVLAAYHVWGAAAVRRLRGMFALLVWDAERRVLFGARDAFGIKPLYVARGAAGIAFASEKKSLVELLPDLRPPGSDGVDGPALHAYLALQYVPEPATLDRRIERIESGTWFTVDTGGRLRRTRWFRPTLHGDGTGGPRLHRRIAAALHDSVAAHLQADVPVGCFLSGGIDSTAIAAIAARHDPDLLTFTVGFGRDGYSEVDVAARTADALGVRHAGRIIGPEEFAAAVPAVVRHLDDPVADPSVVPLWFLAREARRHVTVALSGEGADELFGGYAIYREPRSLAPFEQLPPWLRARLGRIAAALPEGLRGRDLLRRGALTLEERYQGNARIFRPDQLPEYLRGADPAWRPAGTAESAYAESRGWDPVARMQHVDLMTWLRGDILVKADRMSMAHSLEVRVPFLDPVVFEVARGLPPEEKLRRAATKHALRAALAGTVPPHVLHRPKLGFPVPIRHWLREELHDWARRTIDDSGADGLIDLAAARRLLEAHRRGPVDHSRRLWALLVLIVWHGAAVEQRPAPARRQPAVISSAASSFAV